MAQCLSCQRRRALASDCYCRTCLNALHDALAGMLAVAWRSAWIIDGRWWRHFREARRLLEGGPDAA
jgi:hypothetical protein